jgi:AmmeMemoRadiSam system protein B
MEFEKGRAPRLRRDLEIIPAVHRGAKVIVVRDHLGLIESPLVFQEQAASFLGLLDGRNSVEDVQAELVRLQKGVFVSAEEVRGLLAELDSAFVLDTPRFREARKDFIRSYGQLSVRAPVLAGQSYPSDPEGLRGAIDLVLESVEGETVPGGDISAVAAPHIDFETGKKVYGLAYGAIRGLKPGLVVLLGTGHSLEDGYFSLTGKNFQTPLGVSRTDRGLAERLRKAGGKAVAPHDIAHRQEHSLELQVIFLQHIFGPECPLLPVLCGPFERELGKVSRPRDIPGVSDFLEVLTELHRDGGLDVLFVAGVDFSHVGPKFGHRERASSLLPETREHDRTLIEAACRGDVREFWKRTAAVENKFNVCGFSALASLLEIIAPTEGISLGYEIWREDSTQSAVSYAALAFRRR